MRAFYLLFILSLFSVSSLFSQVVVSFTVNGSPCVDNELSFTVNSSITGSSYLWDFGDGNTSNLRNTTHTYTAAGNYQVTFSLVNGGVTYNAPMQSIEIFDNPLVSFDIDTVAFSSYTRVFTSSNNAIGATYVWNFGDASPIVSVDSARAEHKFPEEGSYTVWHTYISPQGCTDSISNIVMVEDLFKVPNVFTPNADGINDIFIVASNGVDRFAVDIYNRWGALVFQRSGEEQIVWDGRMPDGTLVTPGTYFYVITPTGDVATTDMPLNGYITVLY